MRSLSITLCNTLTFVLFLPPPPYVSIGESSYASHSERPVYGSKFRLKVGHAVGAGDDPGHPPRNLSTRSRRTQTHTLQQQQQQHLESSVFVFGEEEGPDTGDSSVVADDTRVLYSIWQALWMSFIPGELLEDLVDLGTQVPNA